MNSRLRDKVWFFCTLFLIITLALAKNVVMSRNPVQNEIELQQQNLSIKIEYLKRPDDIIREAAQYKNVKVFDDAKYVEIEENLATTSVMPLETIEIQPQIIEVDPLANKYETNRLYVTSYAYTDTKYPDQGKTAYYNSAAYNRNGLTSIYDNSDIEYVNGKAYVVHSIASDPKVLPPGSIIYIPKLDMYFRMDDNCGSYSSKLSKKAWNMGASIWIDIYVGRAAYEDCTKGFVLNYGTGIAISGTPNTPNPENIVWADGKFSFTETELNIIKTFHANYYNQSSWTFKLIRYGY